MVDVLFISVTTHHQPQIHYLHVFAHSKKSLRIELSFYTILRSNLGHHYKLQKEGLTEYSNRQDLQLRG